MDTGPAGRARGRNSGDGAQTCGQLLQRYRSLAGLTQEGLAEKAGYSTDYIGKLERDQRELPAAALDRLAAVLGLADQERAALVAARDMPVPGSLLVGRDAEMAEIRRHLAGLGPPVLMFAAEPGMGKTRLLEEAASRAARSGWAIARGRVSGGRWTRTRRSPAPLPMPWSGCRTMTAPQWSSRLDSLISCCRSSPRSVPTGHGLQGSRNSSAVSCSPPLPTACVPRRARPVSCSSWTTCTGLGRMRWIC